MKNTTSEIRRFVENLTCGEWTDEEIRSMGPRTWKDLITLRQIVREMCDEVDKNEVFENIWKVFRWQLGSCEMVTHAGSKVTVASQMDELEQTAKGINGG